MSDSNEITAMSANSVDADGRGISRQAGASLDWAEGEIRRYVNPEHGECPAAHNMLEQLVTAVGESQPFPVNMSDDADREWMCEQVRDLFVERTKPPFKDNPFLIGKVTLDLTGTYGDQPWLSQEDPAIVFVVASSADTAIQSLNPNGRVAAFALRWDPSLSTVSEYVDRKTGEIKTSVSPFEPAAFTDVVAVFDSLPEARQARRDLMRAVRMWADVDTDTHDERDESGPSKPARVIASL